MNLNSKSTKFEFSPRHFSRNGICTPSLKLTTKPRLPKKPQAEVKVKIEPGTVPAGKDANPWKSEPPPKRSDSATPKSAESVIQRSPKSELGDNSSKPKRCPLTPRTDLMNATGSSKKKEQIASSKPKKNLPQIQTRARKFSNFC